MYNGKEENRSLQSLRVQRRVGVKYPREEKRVDMREGLINLET